MAKKRPHEFTSFHESRDILNFKPKIQYIEPDQLLPDFTDTPEDESETLNVAQDQIDELIVQFQQIAEESDKLSEEIDQKARAAVVNLDPDTDSHIIAALQRLLLDKDVQNALDDQAKLAISRNQIPYALYKHCIEDTGQNSLDKFQPVSNLDIVSASSDPFRDSFGALSRLSGLKRPELDPSNQIIDPINLKDFQSNLILELFKQMTPLIFGLVKKIVNPF